MIYCVSGFIGSGKDTVADYLVDTYGFSRASYADTLKDSVAAVFGWDRDMLAGRTKAAREEREQIDQWWAEKLDIPHLTPRWILQYWGTEVCRHHFHSDIWIASLENVLRKRTDDIVITDARFPNEIDLAERLNGKSIVIERGEKPAWYDFAAAYNASTLDGRLDMQFIANLHDAAPNVFNRKIHASEWSWIGRDFTYTVDNNGSLRDLYNQCDDIIVDQRANEKLSMAVDCA